MRRVWYEFFAGGGMARIGLGADWECAFANDWCQKKARAYRAYFGGSELRVCDVADLRPRDLPGTPTLVWGSFPCQDLSLAGNGAGLSGRRSGTFHPFWNLIRGIIDEGRAPRIVVLENVVGTLTSHGGRDFAAVLGALVDAGYRAGAMVMDAALFVPQSRPRLFIVGVRGDFVAGEPTAVWHTTALRRAYENLPARLRESWVWWNVPVPSAPVPAFATLIEDAQDWHTPEQTKRIIDLMSPLHREKLAAAQRAGTRVIGTVYKRMRGENQRAEIRFDDVAGCLRTPAGGSSRQTIFVVEGRSVRSRLLSAREAARLMGVPEDYPLPSNYNDAYRLFGDGVAVPVVNWLNRHLLARLA